MALYLTEILRLLSLIEGIDKEKDVTQSYVRHAFNTQPVKQARFPNYVEIEKFCIDLKLIIFETKKVFLTEQGKNILEYHKEHDITDNFKEFFIKESLFKTDLGKKVQIFLSEFYLGEKQNRWCPKWEICKMFKNLEMLPLLYELDILIKQDSIVEINPKYFQIIDEYQNKTIQIIDGYQKKTTQEELEKQLENSKIIGEIAEDSVVEFEKKRLENEGHIEESRKVCKISMDFVNAGYDVESFLEEQGKIHKIRIEVKGSSEKRVEFYWSRNELKKAKEYGEKYWIYFVGKINIKTRSSQMQPIKIKNPSKIFFSDSSYKVETELYHIVRTDSI